MTEPEFDAELIQKELGHQGKVKDGVLHVSVSRPEPLKMHDAPTSSQYGNGDRAELPIRRREKSGGNWGFCHGE
jgi:hypothetical protein